ncbi:ATP-binding protein [Actinomadura roseirufa]|uniref:ATP-binding protein n=1 Tax=Actinomadura roseirufa TaxID=2094049 RepID=UPI001F5EEE58|nr:ATP-binding protein [Actinomadura roseirufa]
MTVLDTSPKTCAPASPRMSGREHPVGGMCWRRAFAGRPAQARPVREFVAFLAAGFPGADDVVLAAAEMTANAIQHTRSGLPGGLFVVELRRWRGRLALSVTDQGGPKDPRPGGSLRRGHGGAAAIPADGTPEEAFALAESGRGLLAVAAVATGWEWSGGPSGRTVTAIF